MFQWQSLIIGRLKLTADEQAHIREALAEQLRDLRADRAQLEEVQRLLDLLRPSIEVAGESIEADLEAHLKRIYGTPDLAKLTRTQAADLLTALARAAGEIGSEETILPSVTPAEVFGRRVREVRQRRGWSQARLAARLRELGRPMDQSTIHRIESGTTRALNVTLSDVLAIAGALGVSPVFMIFPLDDATRVAITPRLHTPAHQAREWLSGEAMLRDEDDRRTWLTERDEASIRELADGLDRHERARIAREEQHQKDRVLKEREEQHERDRIAELETELETTPAQDTQARNLIQHRIESARRVLERLESMDVAEWRFWKDERYEKHRDAY